MPTPKQGDDGVFTTYVRSRTERSAPCTGRTIEDHQRCSGVIGHPFTNERNTVQMGKVVLLPCGCRRDDCPCNRRSARDRQALVVAVARTVRRRAARFDL